MPLVASCALLGVAVVQAKAPEKPSYLSTERVHIEAASRDAGSTTTAEGEAGAPRKAATEAAAPSVSTRRREAEARTRQSIARRKSGFTAEQSAASAAGPVTAVGDSVMLGAVDALQRDIPNLSTIDARGSRQIPEAIGVLRQLRAADELGEVVIIHMGDNGIITDEQFDEMMEVLSGAREVLVVNTTVPDGH